MKIISKYKDYYDFLVGIYGEDNNIVLDRSDFELPRYSTPIVVTFYIAGMSIDGYWDGKKFYFGEDLIRFCNNQKIDTKYFTKWRLKWMKRVIDSNAVIIYNESLSESQTAYPGLRIDETKVNEKCNCAIMCTNQIRNQYIRYPRLDDFGIITILPPHLIYIMLTDWLAPKEKVEAKMDDIDKLIAFGFDKKTSFRNS